MTATSLRTIAAEFELLAARFQDFPRRAGKPPHLLVNIGQSAIQAGRLLQKAAEAGAFAGDPWWRDGKSPVHPFDDGKGNSIHYESEGEFFSFLWTFAIGSWLVKRFPERFRHAAAEWDWTHVATDKGGRPLGKDGKPLRARWYKDGEPLPAGFRLTPERPPGEYTWQLEGEVAHREDFYDEADCMERLRIRAEVYTDACRLLAALIGNSPGRNERGRWSEYLECNGLERFVVTYVGRFPDLYRNHRPWSTREHCFLELLDDVNQNACPTTLDEVRSVVEQCVAKGWIEWALSEAGEHVLCRTERGNMAHGYGPDGNDAFPTPTITDADAAIPVILRILYEAKHDPQLRYHGDPRVKERQVVQLYQWVRHRGVSREAFLDAKAECKGEGFVAANPCCGGELLRITSRGEQFLRGDVATHPEQLDRRVVTKTSVDAAPSSDGLKDGAAGAIARADPTKPDATGYVARPGDLSSYIPVATIRAEYCEDIAVTSMKQITKILEDYSANRVRWTRPLSDNTGSPNPHRRSVHLVDWQTYVNRLKDGRREDDGNGFPDLSPAEIKERKAKVRRSRPAGK